MRSTLSWDGQSKKVAALALLVALLTPNAAMAAPRDKSAPPVEKTITGIVSARGSSWS